MYKSDLFAYCISLKLNGPISCNLKIVEKPMNEILMKCYINLYI